MLKKFKVYSFIILLFTIFCGNVLAIREGSHLRGDNFIDSSNNESLDTLYISTTNNKSLSESEKGLRNLKFVVIKDRANIDTLYGDNGFLIIEPSVTGKGEYILKVGNKILNSRDYPFSSKREDKLSLDINTKTSLPPKVTTTLDSLQLFILNKSLSKGVKIQEDSYENDLHYKIGVLEAIDNYLIEQNRKGKIEAIVNLFWIFLFIISIIGLKKAEARASRLRESIFALLLVASIVCFLIGLSKIILYL